MDDSPQFVLSKDRIKCRKTLLTENKLADDYFNVGSAHDWEAY